MCVLTRATHEVSIEPIFGAESGFEPELFIWVNFWREAPPPS
jgi:hypothetical protein